MPKLVSAFFHTRTAKLLLLAILISSITVVTVSASTGSPFLSTTCATLTPSVTSVASGTHGTILFTCGTNPGFTVNRPGSAIASYTLPSGYVSLTIVAHVSGATGCSPGQTMVSGQETSFSKTGMFDYCASFADPPLTGLASFKLAWLKE